MPSAQPPYSPREPLSLASTGLSHLSLAVVALTQAPRLSALCRIMPALFEMMSINHELSGYLGLCSHTVTRNGTCPA